MEACRVGWRKPLGHDMQRRRYWALGAATSCWRVYVEEQEGALWGWYQGDSPLHTLTTPFAAKASVCVAGQRAT